VRSGRIPPIAEATLRALVPGEDLEFLLGDYEETFQTAVDARGTAAASRACVADVIRSLPSLFVLRAGRKNGTLHKGGFMTALADLALPPSSRRAGLWTAASILVFELVRQVVTGLWAWPTIVARIVPGVTYDQALSGWWALGAFGVGAVFVFTTFAIILRTSAPRWLWAPFAVMTVWLAGTGIAGAVTNHLTQLAMSQAPATDGAFYTRPELIELALPLAYSLAPLVFWLLPAWLACRFAKDRSRPLVPSGSTRIVVWLTPALVQVVATLIGSAFGSLEGTAQLWAVGAAQLLVPGIACLAFTRYVRAPRSVWPAFVASPLATVIAILISPLWSTGPRAMAMELGGRAAIGIAVGLSALAGAVAGTAGRPVVADEAV